MFIEIEAKLKTDSLKPIADRLKKAGAQFIEAQLHRDSYFDDKNSSFKRADKCLRLRRITAGTENKYFLTYKGPKQAGDLKRRDEIEIELKDEVAAEKLVCALGFTKVAVFEKKRFLWQYRNCQVALDELPLLGSFVEIEGPTDEQINSVRNDLKMADTKHISKSYAELMENELSQLGRTQMNVFFQGAGK